MDLWKIIEADETRRYREKELTIVERRNDVSMARELLDSKPAGQTMQEYVDDIKTTLDAIRGAGI